MSSLAAGARSSAVWCSGKVFVLSSGSPPSLFVARFDMVKRILSDRTGLYAKVNPGPVILALLGMGLVLTEGEDWARHRRVVHPAFAMDKLKMMTGAVAACAGEVIRAWEARAAAAGGEATVEVGQQFTELTADVISHTAFGSSYRRGKEVFLAQRELQHIALAAITSARRVPGMEYAPTKANVRRWQLERKVRDTLTAIIGERLDAAGEARGYGTDLLGLMLEANAGGSKRMMSMDEIIDECIVQAVLLQPRLCTSSPGPCSSSAPTPSGSSGSGRRCSASAATPRRPSAPTPSASSSS